MAVLVTTTLGGRPGAVARVERQRNPGRRCRIVGRSRISRSLSSGRPTGSGLWPARWQAPAGPGGSIRATTLLVIAVVLILPVVVVIALAEAGLRSEEHTSELQSLAYL